MFPLPTTLRLLLSLAVAAFLAVASIEGTAHAKQSNALDAAMVARSAALTVQFASTSVDDGQDSIPLAALDAEASEFEDDEREPQFAVQTSAGQLPTTPSGFSEAYSGVQPEACWASVPVPSSHARGPPVG